MLEGGAFVPVSGLVLVLCTGRANMWLSDLPIFKGRGPTPGVTYLTQDLSSFIFERF
jgi:hypothetical protein